MAALTIAWSAGAMGSVLEHQTPARFAGALPTAVAAQTHYANCIMLAAIGAGAAAVSLWRGDRRLLLSVLAVGAVAAISTALVEDWC